ncbi:MAG: amidohydrolase family protein [Burkholderiaceae bacterium]
MIDAHFHIWQLARADYGWLTPAMGSIHRDVALADWRTVSAPCGIRGGILVQAAPTEAETLFLLQQARDAADVLGVVGWVDMPAHDAPERIAKLARQPKLKALRPMLQAIPDPDWILQSALSPAFQAMLRCDLAFDALIKPEHLPRVATLARRYPALRIVIDHGAKPAIAHGQWQDWADALGQLAQSPQVVCKLSGLWNEAGVHDPLEALKPYASHVMACFGASRVLWGSDWPVLERAGDYATWQAAALRWIEPADHAEVFEGVARRTYRL